jgi:hypothetical protein
MVEMRLITQRENILPVVESKRVQVCPSCTDGRNCTFKFFAGFLNGWFVAVVRRIGNRIAARIDGVLLAPACFLFALFCGAGLAQNSHAGIVERVKSEGAVRRGGAERPGLAGPDFAAGGGWRGLNVEICRANAHAIL